MSLTRLSRISICLVLCALLAPLAIAAPETGGGQNALWLRAAAISPDGKTVAFSYRGDVWTVPSAGGAATPLTVHSAYDSDPVWSPDGRLIAFSSDRYGSADVFVMPSTGGEATRLTFHSAADTPSSFTPDGKSVLFNSARLDTATNVQFPTGAQPELYMVSLEGGMPAQVLSTPAIHASWDKAGRRLAYTDRKGYEMDWRKHDDSSFARDVWMWDRESNAHTRLTPLGGDDRQPVWAPGDGSLYFLSERSGTFNVWRMDLSNPKSPVQVTNHAVHPVRFLSVSSAGDLCYTWDGEILVRPAGASESRKLDVTAAADRGDLAIQPVTVSSEVSEFEVSPDGKEIAFVARGEVFVASVEHGTTRRITDTPGQERSVSFSPDGKSLLYAGERDGSWNVYRTDRADAEEPAFFNATKLVERAVIATEAEEFQPHFSPDGKEVAYLEERTTLKVLTLASGATRVVLPGDMNYSYADGDQWYQWSPDGRSFAVNFLSPGRWSYEAGIVPAAGGTVTNLTRSGYEDIFPRWERKGEVLLWATDRHGAREQSGWSSEMDVFAAFLTRAAWDRFNLDEAAYEQLVEKEKKAEKDKDKAKDDAKEKEKGKDKAKDDKPEIKLPDPVALELEGIEDRTVRLSMHSADLAGASLTPDGETLVYLASFEKGYDLWKYTPRKQEIKLVAKIGAEDSADFRLDAEGKKAIVLADGKLMTVELESGKTKPIAVSAKMELRAAEEREALFGHAWRQTLKKFYVEDMHGVDWSGMKAAYARFLPHIDNNHDFAELISEMQGELNASHTGGRHRPSNRDGDSTAALGFFPDPAWTADGIRILEVIEKSPLQQAGTKVKNGVVITAIDGVTIAAGANWYPMLNRKAGTPVRLSLLDPGTQKRWEETVKPVSWSDQGRLLYQRWV